MIAVTQKLLPTPSKRRPGLKNNGIKFIVAHDTGNMGSTALGNVNYYIQSAHEVEASAHVFIDDKTILMCIPEGEKAYHVRRSVGIDNQIFGCDAIDNALAVELCFGGAIDNMKAYNNYVEYIADACRRYKLDPKKYVIDHAKLDPTRRTDPHNAFKYIKKTWEQFILDVCSKLGQQEEMVQISVPKSKVDKLLAYLKTI